MCFKWCKNLVKEKEPYEISSGIEDEGYYGSRVIFTCGVTGQKMFSSIAERRKLPVINEEDTIRMPLECDKYEDIMLEYLNYFQ